MTISRKTRITSSLSLCAAIVAVGLATTQKAHADVVTATALGGAALLTSLLHSSHPAHVGAVAYPAAYPVAYPAYSYAYPVSVVAPVMYAPSPYVVYYPR